jgi:acetoin utilization protein AcuB
MFVKHFMTKDVIVAREDDEAGIVLQRMRHEGVRRMPVLDADGLLVGLISDRKLLEVLAIPVRRGQTLISAVPSLRIGDLMHGNLLTTTPDVPLEEAAAIMARNRISSLLVVDEEGQLVGIITESDMFRVFLRMLGSDGPGLRVTLHTPAFRGILADVTNGIARAGGNLLTLGSVSDEDGFLVAFNVADLTQQDVEDILRELPVDEVDIRPAWQGR